ncbi:MAG: winged helix-turn-helix domain-containing protein [Inhella sp.]
MHVSATSAPLTLLAVCPGAPECLLQLERLRALGTLVAHTPDEAQAEGWLATLLPDLLLAPPAAGERLRAALPPARSRLLTWDGEPDSLGQALQRHFPALRPAEGPLRFGPLLVHEDQGLVELPQAQGGPRRVHMPATELRLLLCLARQPGRVLSRAELLEQVWPAAQRPQARSVDQVVRRLRQLLQGLGLAASLCSLRGLGYRLDLDSPLADSGNA